MAVMVPVVKASIAKASSKKLVSRQSSVDKQAERRRKIIAKNNSLAEQGAIFKVHLTGGPGNVDRGSVGLGGGEQTGVAGWYGEPEKFRGVYREDCCGNLTSPGGRDASKCATFPGVWPGDVMPHFRFQQSMRRMRCDKLCSPGGCRTSVAEC